MPPHHVSYDLKARIPILFYQQKFRIKEICELLGIKKSLAYSTLQCFQRYGLPVNPHTRKPPGRDRLLSIDDITTLCALIERQHTIYLDEIQAKLLELRGTNISISTLMRTIQRLNLSRKCTSARALERNDIKRSAYMNHIAEIAPDPNMLMFVDEAARNRRTSARTKGWAPVGLRCVQRKYFVRGQRYSILPILTLDGIITYDIIRGSVTSERFLQFLREFVVSLCFSSP